MLSLNSAEPDPARVAESREALGLAAQALTQMSKALREPMVLFIAGYSYEEIALMINVPVGTVKRRLHECRNNLKERMEDILGRDVNRKARQGQTKLRRDLKLGQKGSRMKALLEAVHRATLDAVNEMYLTCERIEIADGKVNGESIPPDAYAAIVERVKVNANLLGESFKPEARSQVLLLCRGNRKDFDVTVTPQMGILLEVRKCGQ